MTLVALEISLYAMVVGAFLILLWREKWTAAIVVFCLFVLFMAFISIELAG